MNFSFIPTVAAATPLIDVSATYSTTDMIRIGVSLVILVALICSFVFVVWWGLMLILSGGKSEKVSSAIGSIRYAIIGIVVIVLAIFLVPKFAELLGFMNFNYISPESIYETVQLLMERITGSSASTSSVTEFDF